MRHKNCPLQVGWTTIGQTVHAGDKKFFRMSGLRNWFKIYDKI